MKNFVLPLFLILFCYNSNAQIVSFGIGGGVTVSTVAEVPFNDVTSTQGKIGSLIYIFGDYTISDTAELHAKLGLDKRVVRSRYPLENFFEFNQISLMPAIKLDMGGQPRRGAFFKPGLRFSYMTSVMDIDNDIKFSDQFNTMNFGFNLGLGADFAKHFGFELLADFGITNEVKNSESKDRINSILILLNINLDTLFWNKTQ